MSNKRTFKNCTQQRSFSEGYLYYRNLYNTYLKIN